jgi:dihydrofolate reductase
MLKFSVFIATSLDGFIAREDGDLDWLPAGGPGDAEDYGYAAFMASIDTLLMGRATYDKVLSFGEWPFGGKRVVVLTHRPIEPRAGVESIAGTPAEVAARLGATGARHVYVDGGRTIQAFLRAGLVQRLVLTRVPVLLGRGLPLFGPLERDVRLTHVSTRAYPSGLVQSEYAVE